jgi:hypothetical protein
MSNPAPPIRRHAQEGKDSSGGTASGGTRRASRSYNPVTHKEKHMRFMVMVKATADSEAGALPTEQLLTDMGNFNEALVKAGVMLAGEGLKPSSRGARVHFSGSSRTVVDGPFSETKELVAGFWLWECKDLDECIAWVKRCPNPMLGPSDIEIRPVFEPEDFGEEFTPALREQEAMIRAQSEGKR